MKIIHRNGEVILLEDDGSQRTIPLSDFDVSESRSAEELDFSDEIRPTSMRERRKQISDFEVSVRNEKEYAFDTFLRQGEQWLDEKQKRALAVGVDASGGYLTPASFADTFTASLKAHDEIFDAARLFETDKGTACGFPTDDDTSAVATLVAENAVSTTASPVTFDNVAFGRCPQWRSGHIVASMELAADSAYPLANVLAGMFGRRMARGVGAQFIANLIADSDAGVTSAATGAVTGDELLDLVASVDPAYAANGGFLMNITTLTALRKLKASTAGSYLLDFDRDPNGRLMLFDFPVFISPSLANMSAGTKPIAFGDLSRFIRRQVRNSLAVKVYNERYAEKGQVGYESFLRVDGKLAKAASSPLPIRFLACHS